MGHHLVDNGTACLAEDEDVALSTRQPYIGVAFASEVGLDVLATSIGDEGEQGWSTGRRCSVFSDYNVEPVLAAQEIV
jgi:hypothetical protein